MEENDESQKGRTHKNRTQKGRTKKGRIQNSRAQDGKKLSNKDRGEGNLQFEDKILKTAAQFFGDDLLPIMGIKGVIRYVAPTEQIHLEARRLEEDFNFAMEDGTLRHLEFESDSIATKDLRRFREYEAYMSMAYQAPVITSVICTSGVKVLKDSLTEGLNSYRIEVIRLKDRDADALFRQVEERQRMEAVLYALAIKFLDRDDLEQVKERFGMTILGQMLMEDGMKKGLEKGEMIKLISQVSKKVKRGLTSEAIAELLEEAPETVERICQAVKKHPEFGAEELYEQIAPSSQETTER